MSEFSQGTESQREEMFREFHAEHLRRQTKAIETIRGVAVTWLVLTIIGILFFMIAMAGQSSSGY